MLRLKCLLFDVLIWIVERQLYATPIKYAFDDERQQKFFANLYDMPGFREYCIERETRFVHALANEEAATQRAQMRGQRVETMLWFSKAKKAFDKQASLRKGADSSGSSPKR